MPSLSIPSPVGQLTIDEEDDAIVAVDADTLAVIGSDGVFLGVLTFGDLEGRGGPVGRIGRCRRIVAKSFGYPQRRPILAAREPLAKQGPKRSQASMRFRPSASPAGAVPWGRRHLAARSIALTKGSSVSVDRGVCGENISET